MKYHKTMWRKKNVAIIKKDDPVECRIKIKLTTYHKTIWRRIGKDGRVEKKMKENQFEREWKNIQCIKTIWKRMKKDGGIEKKNERERIEGRIKTKWTM